MNLRLIASLALFSISLEAFAQTQDTAVSFQYDSMGRLVQKTRPLGLVSTFAYDAFSRLTSEGTYQSSDSIVYTNFMYDRLGQVTSIIDPRSLTTGYTIDGLGGKLAQNSPDTRITSYTVDGEGRLLASLDARGKQKSFSYDALGRLLQVSYASGDLTVFEYDGGPGGPASEIGQLTKVTDQAGTTSFTHDQRGRVLSRKQVIAKDGISDTKVISYTYLTSGNGFGKVATMTYPSGARINYAYDDAGRVSSVNLNPQDGAGGTNNLESRTLVQSIRYSATGAVKSWEWGDAAEWPSYRKSYDLDGRLVSYPIDATDTIRTVSYNAANLIVGYTHTGGLSPSTYDRTFGYDLAERLRSESSLGVVSSYTFDKNGNRTQRTNPTETYSFESSSNRLLTAASSSTKTFNYDAAGNQLSDGKVNYVYSDDGRLIRVYGSQLNATYFHNGKGERVAKIVNNIITTYAFDEDGKTVGEYRGSDTVETVYLGTTPVAVVTPQAAHAIFADHIDTPLAVITLGTGKIAWDWRLRDAYGTSMPITGFDMGIPYFNHRFPGQIYDAETGLFYNYLRDYDPRTGRYIQSDPIEVEGGINTYIYALNNPIKYFDPSGQFVPLVIPALCAAGGCEAIFAAAAAGAAWWGISHNPMASSRIDSPGGTAAAKECPPEDRCSAIRAKIRDLEAKLNKKIAQLNSDPYNLYNLAYSENPGGNLAGKGTYVGHLDQIAGLRLGLERAKQQAREMRCL